MALVTVAADKHHLVDAKGHPFFILGVNYTGYFDRAWKLWEPDLFDVELITRDFRKAQNSGFNSVRLFVYPALEQELRQNNFAHLDQTLSIAQDHNLKVVLTLNEAHSVNLERVSQLDCKIAERYQEVSTVLAYDLQNKPVFYNLAGAVYPEGYQAAVQSSQLIDHYGVRVNREETQELQRSGRIPGHLNPDQAFYYINALRLFIEYDEAIKRFINQGRGTIMDFLLSGEAVPWHTLIGVLDSTLETWLRTRIDPLRATGCRQLLTVGWNWLHFAALPANRLLDFQQYHHFAELSLVGFNTLTAHLGGLQRAFPQHPLVLGEFGWSNQSSSNPATSQPVSVELTAVYEAACYAYLRANNLAGGFKWVLNDLEVSHNPYEANLGVFQAGDQPKSIRELISRFSEEWPTVDQPATFIPVGDLETGLSYRLDLPQQTWVGGHIYQDRSLSWRAEGVAGHSLVQKANQELWIDALSAGELSLVPWELLPGWNRAREADLYRLFDDHHRSRQRTFPVGESVVIEMSPGARYAIAMGKEGPFGIPSEDFPEVEPNPGEHVILLGDSDQYLPAALKYIRRFAPDLTFAAGEVDGRWAYVSVVATPQQVPDEALEVMRSVGAILVERVVDTSPEATRLLLDRLASQGQRFLTAVTPPQDEPAEPPQAEERIYVVQPGDTLSLVAQKIYGQAHLWSLIFEANRDKLSNPNLIRVGMELLLPEREGIQS